MKKLKENGGGSGPDMVLYGDSDVIEVVEYGKKYWTCDHRRMVAVKQGRGSDINLVLSTRVS